MYLLFDIGGTKMRLAISADGREIGSASSFNTPKNFDEGVNLLIEEAKKITADIALRAIAGGVPGVLAKDKETLFSAPNLPEWVGKPLKAKLKEVFGVSVYLENDTDMIGLGEAVSGAGRGYDIVAYLTVSTGVGGTRIVNGRLDRFAYGFEPGHQIISEGVENFYDLEDYIGGASLEKRTGKKVPEIDEQAIWDEVIEHLTTGLNNTIVHWSPEVVILGGGLITGDKISIEKVRERLSEKLRVYPELPEIKKAELGDLGGLHGALLYLKYLLY